MPIALSSVYNELLPGLREITGKYPEIPSLWKQYYTKQGKSKMAMERTSAMRFMGLARLKSEGQATSFDNGAGDRFTYNHTPVEVGLGYAITRPAIDDNLYKTAFNPTNLGLQASFAQFKEIQAANILNTATTYDATIVGDGVALCATNHPVDGSTFANRPSTDLDLNEAAVYSAAIAVRKFRDNANLRARFRTKRLIVPLELEYVASRLLNTELRPGTANNDINAIRENNLFPDGYLVVDYLTSQYAWMVLTDAPEGLLYLERVPFEMSMWTDDVTDNLLVKGYERFYCGYDGPRGIYGSFPTN